jgi:nucleoid-associated protein YgaU
MKDQTEGEMDPKKKPAKPDERKGSLAGGPKAFDPGKMGRPAPKAEKEYAFIATHTVESGDTLSGLAKKFYGSEAQAYWMEIYEANKEVIGDNPNVILIGQVLNIPEKPKL